MKSKFFILCLCLLMLMGCGSKEKEKLVCTYTITENDISLVVNLVFERNNKKDVIDSGKFIMNYEIFNITEDIENDRLKEMFSSECDNLSDMYTDCSIEYVKNGAKVTNVFNINKLQISSGGKFKNTMSLEEVKNYIIETNSFDGMMCNIE